MGNTKLLKSDTKVYNKYRKEFVSKWMLWEKKMSNGTRMYMLTYYNDHKHEYRSVPFTQKVVTARLRYMSDNLSEMLMEQLNDGTLYRNLLRLDNKVEKAVDNQVMLWQDTDKEYLAASGDFMKQFAISQRMRMEAEHQLYNTMVYV